MSEMCIFDTERRLSGEGWQAQTCLDVLSSISVTSVSQLLELDMERGSLREDQDKYYFLRRAHVRCETSGRVLKVFEAPDLAAQPFLRQPSTGASKRAPRVPRITGGAVLTTPALTL